MAIEIKARIKEVIQRNYNVKSIRLEIPGVMDFKAGQFLLVKLQDDLRLKKYLSISSSPTEKYYLEFTKKLTESDFSKALDNLRVGDQVTIQYPFGKFVLDESFSKIAFLSGGIGITPIRSICKYVVDNNLGSDIVLVYANRFVKDVVFKEDFEAWMKSYPALRVVHVLSETEPGFKCTVGRINREIIKNEISDYRERKFYLCGPPQMVEAMRKLLAEELEVSPEMIVTENFQGY
ncbi:MAG: FAD-dependent oxidoreductase [Candidatus Omnitrophota bacterium]